MKFKFRHWKYAVSLILVLLVAAALRVYKVDELPALNADEAAIGYNAYSLLETGKDEFGTSWPLVFRSFDDYKPGIYFYLVMPWVNLWGLNVWSVRMPGILLSLVTVLGVSLIIREVYRSKFADKDQSSKRWAFWSGLALAIMPWHIHFSRGGWEAQAATAMLVIGTWMLYKGLKRIQWFYGGVSFYLLSLYTYHSMRVVAPLLGLSFVWIYRKRLWRFKGNLVTVGVLSFLLVLPLGLQLLSDTGLSRAQGVSIWADSGPFWRANEVRSYHQPESNLLVRIIQNKYVHYGLAIGENYVSHFSGSFLFVEGDEIQRNRIPNMGQLYWVFLPFTVWGLLRLLGSKGKFKRFILAWLIIAPIPAALTFQSPHAVRAIAMTIPLAWITGLGVNRFLETAKEKSSARMYKVVTASVLVVFGWGVGRYWVNYNYLLVPTYPQSSQYGFEELVPWIEAYKDQYDRIYVTDRYDQPYILWLFYSKFPPSQFQLEAEVSTRDEFGFGTVREYGIYRFESIDWELLKETKGNERWLVVGTPEEIPDGVTIINQFGVERGPVLFEVAEL